jgi:hypothetical protein
MTRVGISAARPTGRKIDGDVDVNLTVPLGNHQDPEDSQSPGRTNDELCGPASAILNCRQLEPKSALYCRDPTTEQRPLSSFTDLSQVW